MSIQPQSSRPCQLNIRGNGGEEAKVVAYYQVQLQPEYRKRKVDQTEKYETTMCRIDHT
jgi:hypothetical protein